MGHEARARCQDCGARFSVSEGGGFTFHLLRCDQCGSTKAVRFSDLGETHIRYVKGLSVPYSMATAAQDAHIQQNVDVVPLTEDDYYRAVEAVAGPCSCGGRYTFRAPPRCPKCRSPRVKIGPPTLFYD